MHILRCTGSRFCVKFQRTLWNFTRNLKPIHARYAFHFFSIFACELRYFLDVTSKFLLRRAPGRFLLYVLLLDTGLFSRMPCQAYITLLHQLNLYHFVDKWKADMLMYFFPCANDLVCGILIRLSPPGDYFPRSFVFSSNWDMSWRILCPADIPWPLIMPWYDAWHALQSRQKTLEV